MLQVSNTVISANNRASPGRASPASTSSSRTAAQQTAPRTPSIRKSASANLNQDSLASVSFIRELHDHHVMYDLVSIPLYQIPKYPPLSNIVPSAGVWKRYHPPDDESGQYCLLY